MLKFIAGGMLVVGGYALGNSIKKIYEDRICVLERFLDFLIYCESEITFYKNEFSIIIKNFKKEENKYDKYIFNGKTSFIFTKKNKIVIDKFFTDIGKFDMETQMKKITDIKNIIIKAINQANNDLLLKGNTYKKLSPIIALGIFILLL